MSIKDRVAKAIDYAVRYGQIDGAHHKAWVIDQMVRALTGCPVLIHEHRDRNGTVTTDEEQLDGDEYRDLIAHACDGDDDPDTYSWDEGVPP